MDKYTLNNGLRVVIEKIPTCRSVAFGIWVKTGSRNENEKNNGISHFIEHMLFKGTDKYSAKDIAEIFDGIGGNVNAFTSKEYTCYYCKVLDEHLPLAVEVLSDMFFRSVFDPAELEKEKNVIYEEISMYEDTPDDMVHDLIARAAFGGHTLGYTIIGTQDNLAAMNSDTLRSYMKTHYTPSNTVVSIAGNVNDDVLKLIEQHFSGFAGDAAPETREPLGFHSELEYYQKKTEQNHICLSLPGLSVTDERLYAMILLNNAIGGGMSSRLFQEIREKRGLAYSVYSYHTSYQDGGMFTIYTGTAPKQTVEVLKVTMEMLDDIKRNGLTPAELRKGKEQMKGSLILSLESTSSRMNRIGKNELMLGRHYSLDEMIERIERVEMEQIQALTASLLSTPFALAMVGQSNDAIDGFGRDQLV
ncbi:pitrilysin family protein [Paenibacillus validus]|uniref:Insulinase family protein n=1 Tax=Paenibacillus validus TaxID=44253 RepID=A0A7X2Z910_9BACL|nr:MULTISPECIES: pitrilysin family protein [Paenibacillus]MED4603501.1 pitrilysin family protein [Paenibacillus validus]MED4607824.1 pitrilysin family protein [Paenibacillus validus]MUG70476.1 insulinase family protein [Paenibacillus validus]